MENIIWKPVIGYEGLYEVSNTGLVRSLTRHTHKDVMLRKAVPTKYGYLEVRLSHKGNKKAFRIHRLVAEAFIPNPNQYPYINHKDEDKTNNCVDNLEWCDARYNTLYSLALHPERKEKCRNVLINPETGVNISPFSQKGVPHKYNQKVFVIDEQGNVIEVYENAAMAAKVKKLSICNVLRACKANIESNVKHKAGGYIFKFEEE